MAVHSLHTGVIHGFFSNRLKSNNILLNPHRMVKNQDEQKRIVELVVMVMSFNESLSIVISIMQKCISSYASLPSIKDIFWNLQYAAQVQATAEGELRFDK
ncbi:hypothetical protein TorRG33x02_250360 [Trema orientale]|uniref:Uncharacterized protein n=1 Tax=Trema orientale TaxID=63057 RepID=A0A2P5DIH3_TREOI|nr:hypothetical protein TorRG33x02_250360 [Trema orientale]